MERCSGPLEREFYLRMTRKFGWSKNVLIHQIDNQSYEKSLLGQSNFDQALTPEQRNQAKLAVKDDVGWWGHAKMQRRQAAMGIGSGMGRFCLLSGCGARGLRGSRGVAGARCSSLANCWAPGPSPTAAVLGFQGAEKDSPPIRR